MLGRNCMWLIRRNKSKFYHTSKLDCQWKIWNCWCINKSLCVNSMYVTSDVDIFILLYLQHRSTRISSGARCGVVVQKRTESHSTDKQWPDTAIRSTCMPVSRDALPALLFFPPRKLKAAGHALVRCVWTQITSPRSVKYATADTLCFTFCIFIMHLLQRLAARAFFFIQKRDQLEHLIKKKYIGATFMQYNWVFKFCAKFKANCSPP